MVMPTIELQNLTDFVDDDGVIEGLLDVENTCIFSDVIEPTYKRVTRSSEEIEENLERNVTVKSKSKKDEKRSRKNVQITIGEHSSDLGADNFATCECGRTLKSRKSMANHKRYYCRLRKRNATESKRNVTKSFVVEDDSATDLEISTNSAYEPEEIIQMKIDVEESVISGIVRESNLKIKNIVTKLESKFRQDDSSSVHNDVQNVVEDSDFATCECGRKLKGRKSMANHKRYYCRLRKGITTSSEGEGKSFHITGEPRMSVCKTNLAKDFVPTTVGESKIRETCSAFGAKNVSSSVQNVIDETIDAICVRNSKVSSLPDFVTCECGRTLKGQRSMSNHRRLYCRLRKKLTVQSENVAGSSAVGGEPNISTDELQNRTTPEDIVPDPVQLLTNDTGTDESKLMDYSSSSSEVANHEVNMIEVPKVRSDNFRLCECGRKLKGSKSMLIHKRYHCQLRGVILIDSDDNIGTNAARDCTKGESSSKHPKTDEIVNPNVAPLPQKYCTCECGRILKGRKSMSGHKKYFCRLRKKINTQREENVSQKTRDDRATCECGSVLKNRQCLRRHKTRYCRLMKRSVARPKYTVNTVSSGANAVMMKSAVCECGKKFYRKSTLFRHQRESCNFYKEGTSSIQRGVDDATSETSVNSNNLQSSNVDQNDGNVLCVTCNISFATHRELEMHKRINHRSNKCSYCTFTSESRIKLGKHMSGNHEKQKKISCHQCGNRFFTKKNLRVHLRQHADNPQQFTCEVCGKSFRSALNLKYHFYIHTGEKPNVCTDCGKGFIQPGTLYTHRKIWHSTERKHVCTDCGATFKLRGHLKKHQERHTNKKTFKCAVCERMFRSNGELKRHLMTHTGERKFKCQFCGKSFGRNSNLKVHLMIHTGETPHVCEVCGKGFIQAHCLRAHMNTHK